MVDRLTNTTRRTTTGTGSTTGPTAPTRPSTPATPAAASGTVAWAPKSNDKVLFVAVNNSADHMSTQESDALKARGVDINVIKDSDDKVTAKDARGVTQTYDLTTPEGSMAFALTLGLPAEQTKAIAAVIDQAGPDAKDEFAHIAQAWAPAEKGGQIPSRLILSGHHVGYGVYGENNGRLDWPTVGALTEAMPKAARSVQDLMIAGCYSGGQSMMDKYATMFPNLKTAVAYDGSSPGAASGAIGHQKKWEEMTRGNNEPKRAAFQGMRKGENVTVWSRAKGFDDGKPPQALSELKDTRAQNQSAFDDAWSGKTPITDPQQGPVRDFYSMTQRMIQHPETTPADRKTLEAQRDQTIRLLFYGPVSKKFGETYGAKVADGYQALGLKVPDFKTLSRADALSTIKAFQDKLAGTTPPPTAATKVAQMLQDFADLKPSIIPDTWV
jgi:hypothetical protein